MMQYLTKALLAACWFMLLTFPVMGIKLNSVDQTVEWQFDRVILLGVAIFFLSMLWNWCFSRKARGIPLIRLPEGLGKGLHSLVTLPNRNTTTRLTSLGLLLAVMIVMPLVSSFYQTNIMISAMLYVILALGLNIAVGIAGQLVLAPIPTPCSTRRSAWASGPVCPWAASWPSFSAWPWASPCCACAVTIWPS